MSTSDNSQIFICYARRNKNWLPKLRAILKEFEPSIFIDTQDIQTAQEWDPTIDKAISNAKVAICLVTRHFFRSEYIQDHELPRIEKRLLDNSIGVISILVDGCEEGLKDNSLKEFQCLNGNDYLDEPEDLDKYRDKLKLAVVQILDGRRPPLPSSPSPVSNLPAKPKWFVGYETEKGKLTQYILSGQRLVSIIGAPRTGRRTLAKQVAHELFDNGDLPGGAIWIDCQKIEDEKALISAVSEVYLRSHAPENPVDCQQILIDEFSKKRCLIVLENTENPRTDFLERWAKKIPSPSVVINVTALFSYPEESPHIHLRGLDEPSAESLFIKVASEALNTETPFLKKADFVRIRDICRETRNNPLLVEIYANKSGQGLDLIDILDIARSNQNEDTITIWKNQLEPLFSGLDEKHREAFLKLCRLPDGVSRELVWGITGLEPRILGPAIRKQFLWDMGYQRYLIDPSVRTFAETKLTRPTFEVDGDVAAAFARVAEAQAALIDQSLVSDRQALEEAIEWFVAEWGNLKFCVGAADLIGDKETICRLADSILQFMIRHGKFEYSLELYKKALGFRNKDDYGRARTLNDMAVCLQFLREYATARIHIQESIKLWQELIEKSEESDALSELMFRTAQSWNTRGFINLLNEGLGDNRFVDAVEAFKTAENFCQQALNVATDETVRTKIEIEQSQTLSNIGHCFTEWGHQTLDPVKREEHFKEADKAFTASIAIERLGDERVGQTYSRRGHLRLEQHIWPLAENDFNEAIKIFESVSNMPELGLAHLGRGRMHASKHSPDYDVAIKDFERAGKIFEELCYRNEQCSVLMELAEIDKKRGGSGECNATKAFGIAEKANHERMRDKARKFLEDIQT